MLERMLSGVKGICVAAALVFLPSFVQAQQTNSVQTTVLNPVQDDRPVVGAEVILKKNGGYVASGFTDENGQITLDYTVSSIGDDNTNTAYGFKVFPNPSSGEATLSFSTPFSDSRHTTLSIYNLLGQRVVTSTFQTDPGRVYETNFRLNAAGVYLVVQQTGDTVQQTRMTNLGGSSFSSYFAAPQLSGSLDGISSQASYPSRSNTNWNASDLDANLSLEVNKDGYNPAVPVVVQNQDGSTTEMVIDLNPRNPVLFASSFGGDQGAQVCYDSDVLEDLVDDQSIDDIPFSVTAASQSSNLSLTQSLDEICFVSEAPGDHPFTVTATSAVGGETTAQYHYATTPTTTVRVENSDSRDVPPGNIAYLVVGADSLFSSSGVFNIPVGSNVKVGFKNAVGQYTSFVRTVAVELDNSVLAQGNEPGFYVRPFDFYLRDENYVVVDSLSRTGGEHVKNVVGFRNWIDHLWVGDGGNGVTRWNINPNIQGSDPNTFNFFTQSENGRGPESLIIPDIFYVENTDFSHYLDDHTRNLMINTVENHIFPFMGFNGVFAPPIVQPDSISFLATNNQYKNHMILAPRNNFPPGVAGSIAVYGEAPNNIYSTSARIRSPPVPNDDQMIRAISQEMMAAAIMNTIPANPASLPDALAEHYQSILHNSTSLVTPSIYDIKLLRFVWEPTYVGAVTDVIELPPGTNQNAMYQTPSGIQLINPLETNESGEQLRYRQPILDSTGKPIQSQQENNTQETSYNNIQLINPLREYRDREGNKVYETALLDRTGKPYAKTSIPAGTDLTDKLEAAHEQRASNRTTPKIALVPFTYKTQDANGKEHERQTYFTLAA